MGNPEHFSEYSCVELAHTLSQKLECPVKLIVADGEMYHTVVELSDDRYVDIFGVWNKKNLLEYWRRYNLSISHRNKHVIYTLKSEQEVPYDSLEYEPVEPELLIEIVDSITKRLNP